MGREMSCDCDEVSSRDPADKAGASPDSSLQPLKPTKHGEQRYKPQNGQSHPYDELPGSIILTPGAAPHLRLYFSVPFPDDALWVVLHPSFPVPRLIGVRQVQPDRADEADKSGGSISLLNGAPPDHSRHDRLSWAVPG